LNQSVKAGMTGAPQPSERAEFDAEDSLLASTGSFQCERCLKTFTRHWSLTRHQSVCASVCLIPCELCDQTFSRTDNLKAHMQRVHGLGPSMRCQFCFVQFRSKVGLDRHLSWCAAAIAK
jgi:hypothetical protein